MRNISIFTCRSGSFFIPGLSFITQYDILILLYINLIIVYDFYDCVNTSEREKFVFASFFLNFSCPVKFSV